LYSIALFSAIWHDLGMSGKPAKPEPKIQEKDVVGLKYFDQLAPLLARLHDVGCERDKAHNRILHYDQYCMLILLYFFNPIVKSIRGLQQASELNNVQKRLGCPRSSLGSLSESVAVFDPELLKEIIAELGQQLQPLAKDPRLKDIQQTVTLVDSTLISILPHLTEAWLKPTNTSGLVKWRLHTHFEVERYVPRRIDVTADDGGDNEERAVLERTIESDRLYVMDRGFAKFSLFNSIVAKKSSYVCRIRDNSVFKIVEERELTKAAIAERVTSDSIITLGADSSTDLDHKVRLITIAAKPHKKRTIAPAPNCDGTIRIVTNLLDVPADVIAHLYHYRWTIEIFFRFMKQTLGCRHLLSGSQNGIEIQTYCAIIACMLISLWTGGKPTLRTVEMICFYFMGIAELDELMSHIEKLKKRDAK
jgi:hypothetical protein